MVFVALHEMGHVITPVTAKSHGPEFWNNFGWLLREAEAIEIYQYQVLTLKIYLLHFLYIPLNFDYIHFGYSIRN